MRRTKLWLMACLAALTVSTGIFASSGGWQVTDWNSDALQCLSPMSICIAAEACDSNAPAGQERAFKPEDFTKPGSPDIGFVAAEIPVDVVIAELESFDGKEGLRLFGDGKKFGVMDTSKCIAMIAELQKQKSLKLQNRPTGIGGNVSARRIEGHRFESVIVTVYTESVLKSLSMSSLVQYSEIGFNARVTPKLSAAGKILLQVCPELSYAETSSVNIGNGVFATAFHVQALDPTVVSLGEGETAIIGWLTDPFDAESFPEMRKRTELLLFLTPHVEQRGE